MCISSYAYEFVLSVDWCILELSTMINTARSIPEKSPLDAIVCRGLVMVNLPLQQYPVERSNNLRTAFCRDYISSTYCLPLFLDIVEGLNGTI